MLETNCTDNYSSINTFALRSPKAIHLLPGEHGEIFGETIEVGGENWRAGAQKRQYMYL